MMNEFWRTIDRCTVLGRRLFVYIVSSSWNQYNRNSIWGTVSATLEFKLYSSESLDMAKSRNIILYLFRADLSRVEKPNTIRYWVARRRRFLKIKGKLLQNTVKNTQILKT